MTECERIVEQGILPASFFREETICDFYVDEKRKKIWAVCIDMLVKLDEICRKHKLRYSLAFGSLLGAIRHNGFIPWDDDIDVVMPREDYEKLKRYKSEFSQPYYLQFPGEDGGYFFSFAKLRNSNTSAISWAFRDETFNQGMFLDIFPIDNCKLESADVNWEIINQLILQLSTNMRRSLKDPTPKDIERFQQFPYRDSNEVLKELNSIVTQYNDVKTEMGIVAVSTISPARKLTFKWSDVLDTIDVNFYGHKIMIPRNYDSILKVTYGDYIKFPPVEERGTWHNSVIFDPDKPYTEYLKSINV